MSDNDHILIGLGIAFGWYVFVYTAPKQQKPLLLPQIESVEDTTKRFNMFWDVYFPIAGITVANYYASQLPLGDAGRIIGI